MLRLLCSILILNAALPAKAQIIVQADNPGIDTLQVVFYKDKWAIQHHVKKGQNLFLLSRRYHVPPALLTDMNDINFQTELQKGTDIYVPIGAFNQAKEESTNRFDVRPLYYIVRKYDNLYRLAHLAGVPQKKLQEWNAMPDNYVEEGRRLFVGWVLYDISDGPLADTVQVNKKKTDKTYNNTAPSVGNGKGVHQTVTIIRKGNKLDTLSEIEKKYREQTHDEMVVTEEKGSAVFYENKGKLSVTNTYFAFHNTAKPGTVIKVYNPGTDKTVFVKVLGPIPNTKMYHNSVIGISSGAKEALLVEDEKAWCELKFAP